MTPDDLDLEDQLEFLSVVLPHPPARVLDVGCGKGQVSSALMARGFQVVGLDPDPEVVQVAQNAGVRAVEASFLEYPTGEQFDVLLFSRSLHHIPDLDAAVNRVCDFLEPGGIVVIDEFAREQVDSATATWFYGVQDLLESADVSDDPRHLSRHSFDEEPLARWHLDHTHDPPLHTGASMLDALGRRVAIEHNERTAYLWSYLCEWVEPSDRGYRVADSLRRFERALIREGSVAPVGLRVTGRSPHDTDT